MPQAFPPGVGVEAGPRPLEMTAQKIARARFRQGGQAVQRQARGRQGLASVQVGQIVQQVRRLGETPGGPGQNRAGAGKARLQQGQDFMAQGIPGQMRSIVCVLHPFEAPVQRPGHQPGAGNIQQGPQQAKAAAGEDTAHRHGRQALGASATQELGEHGLGLVVPMMGQRQGIGVQPREHAVAGRPGRPPRSPAPSPP